MPIALEPALQPRGATPGGAARAGPRGRRGRDALVDEVPVAMVYGGVTLGVLMATPADLVDFAVGFTLTEGVSAAPSAVEEIGRAHV